MMRRNLPDFVEIKGFYEYTEDHIKAYMIKQTKIFIFIRSIDMNTLLYPEYEYSIRFSVS